MKKAVLVLLIFFLTLSAYPLERFRIGVFSGYFLPRDQILKEVYGSSGDLSYGLLFGVRVWNNFYINLSASQFRTVSRTTFTGDITRLTLNPLDLSIKYAAPLGNVNPFLEIGYTHMLFSEKSEIGTINENGDGFFIGTGIEFNISPKFVLGITGKYNKVLITSAEEEVDLGGLQVSLSIQARI